MICFEPGHHIPGNRECRASTMSVGITELHSVRFQELGQRRGPSEIREAVGAAPRRMSAFGNDSVAAQ